MQPTFQLRYNKVIISISLIVLSSKRNFNYFYHSDMGYKREIKLEIILTPSRQGGRYLILGQERTGQPKIKQKYRHNRSTAHWPACAEL